MLVHESEGEEGSDTCWSMRHREKSEKLEAKKEKILPINSFLPLLWCQRRPQEYAPLSSIDCVDLARSATRTASPAEISRPSIFYCRAVPKTESSFPTSPAHTAEGRKTGICITFCVRVNKSASEGRGRKKF